MTNDIKIAICAANFVGKQLSSYIVKQQYPIQFAITGINDSYEKEISDIYSQNNIKCHRKIDINSEEFLNLLEQNDIDLVFLLWWPKIVKSKIIKKAKLGFVNLHPSLLPYNRGKHPYYWSIIDDTPAGVSIHYITEGVDDGDVLCQKEIKTDITTTGASLYSQSIKEIISLFKKNYDNIVKQEIKKQKQQEGKSTFHLGKELDAHSRIDLNKNYKALELLNIMRARSGFDGGTASFFHLNGEKYYVNIEVTKARD